MKQLKEVYANTFGFELTLPLLKEVKPDAKLKLRIRSPQNSSNDKTSNMTTEGQELKYLVERNDFIAPGIYQIQVFDESNGFEAVSAVEKIRVRTSLNYIAS